jgi:hypothetical protein
MLFPQCCLLRLRLNFLLIKINGILDYGNKIYINHSMQELSLGSPEACSRNGPKYLKTQDIKIKTRPDANPSYLGRRDWEDYD